MILKVIGKPGCPKCALLKQKAERIASESDGAVTVEYCDCSTEEGLVGFCRSQVNPNAIPAILPAADDGECFEADEEDRKDPARTTRWLGLQTDWKSGGRISSEMILKVMEEARKRSQKKCRR